MRACQLHLMIRTKIMRFECNQWRCDQVANVWLIQDRNPPDKKEILYSHRSWRSAVQAGGFGIRTRCQLNICDLMSVPCKWESVIKYDRISLVPGRFGGTIAALDNPPAAFTSKDENLTLRETTSSVPSSIDGQFENSTLSPLIKLIVQIVESQVHTELGPHPRTVQCPWALTGRSARGRTNALCGISKA